MVWDQVAHLYTVVTAEKANIRLLVASIEQKGVQGPILKALSLLPSGRLLLDNAKEVLAARAFDVDAEKKMAEIETLLEDGQQSLVMDLDQVATAAHLTALLASVMDASEAFKNHNRSRLEQVKKFLASVAGGCKSKAHHMFMTMSRQVLEAGAGMDADAESRIQAAMQEFSGEAVKLCDAMRGFANPLLPVTQTVEAPGNKPQHLQLAGHSTAWA